MEPIIMAAAYLLMSSGGTVFANMSTHVIPYASMEECKTAADILNSRHNYGIFECIPGSNTQIKK